MKKQGKQLILLLVVLILLGGCYLLLSGYNEKKASEESEEEQNTLYALDLNKQDVTGISYEYDGEEVTLEKQENTWYDAKDHAKTMNQVRISTMVSGIAPLSADREIRDVKEKDQYGLTKPAQEITIKTQDAEYTIQVGDKNEVTSQTYVSINGESTVYLVATVDTSRFLYKTDDLMDQDANQESAETSSEESAE